MKSRVKNGFNPLVSIIIPVYNGSNYVREAIDSALNQTYENIEIIVVNDGSKDNTDEIVRSYGKKVRYFKKENGGTSTALNVGIKNMKGDYFSWLSHDDQYYPKKIERQIEELSKLENKNTIMMTDLDGIDENYKKIYKTNYIDHINQYPQRLKSYIYPIVYNRTHGCTLLIPKICFKEIGLFDENSRVAQDFEYFYKIFLKYPHKLIPEILVTARDSSGRQGRRSKVRGSLEYSNLYIKIINNLSDDDISLLAKSKLDFYNDMYDFFKCAGYRQALKYINKKLMRNVQISSYDLIGNKFNGYDLHLDLREFGISSKDLVLYKESDDLTTYSYNFLEKDSIKTLLQQKIFLDSELIHLHLIHNIFDINYLPILSRLKPTVLTLHDPYFLGGHCVHHFDCNKWITHCKDCKYLNVPMEIGRDITALNFELKKTAIQCSNVSGIVASRWMEEMVKRSPVWRGKKIYYLPFGIDQKLFCPANSTRLAKKKIGIDESSFTIMFRADEVKYKGIDIIIDSLKGLDKKNITLISVGKKGLLNSLASRYSIKEYEWIKDDVFLSNLYKACDLFLMPSRQETFGMMAIEAMSCGKMVLALDTDESALPETINSPECGLAVKIENFSKALNEMVSNSKEVKLRGERSLIYARKMYSKEKYIKGMVEIYRDVIYNHKIDKDAKLVLNQLKKYGPSDYEISLDDNLNNKDKGLTVGNLISNRYKQTIKDYILIVFYKVDKIFPKIVRKFFKPKMMRFGFVKKYLIKYS